MYSEVLLMPVVIRQRLSNIDHDIYHLNEERKKLEAELARVGLKAVEYPSSDPQEATLEEILQGNWHFKNPTPEAREIFESKGVPLEDDPIYWQRGRYEYAEWFSDLAYTDSNLCEQNEQRELIILNGKLHFAS